MNLPLSEQVSLQFSFQEQKPSTDIAGWEAEVVTAVIKQAAEASAVCCCPDRGRAQCLP